MTGHLDVLSAPYPGSIAVRCSRAAEWPDQVVASCLPGAGTDRILTEQPLAVTTGQQPGLFGGPLYTIHKALAARAMAHRLEQLHNRPFVPVFWIAGDDHDWVEASNATWWHDGDQIRTWRLTSRPDDAPQLPLYRLPVPIPELEQAITTLANDLPVGLHRERVNDWLRHHWLQPEATMGSAFGTAINELLAPLGIVCLDPTSNGFKRSQAEILHAALVASEQLDSTLAGVPDPGTGIAAGDGATLVFLESGSGRDRLVRTGDGRFATRRGGEEFGLDQLEALLAKHPERFSANVLLRPVVEAALLPTVGYVAGPGEARYLTRQASKVYQVLGVEPQEVVPRWSGTIIDDTSRRLLDRIEITAEMLLEDDLGIEREILLDDMPSEVIDALIDLGETIAATSEQLREAGRSIDPVLDRAITTRQHRLAHLADDLGNLMERHLKKRDGIAWAQYQRLRRRLIPQGRPQERVICAAGAMGIWDRDWFDSVITATDSWATAILEPASIDA